MGKTARVDSQSPFGSLLPPDAFSAVVEHMSDMVLVTEANPIEEPGMRILFANPAFEKMSGYRIGEALGRSPRFLHGPGTSLPEVARLEDSLRAGRAVRSRLLLYRSDGTVFGTEVQAYPSRSPATGTEYFVLVGRRLDDGIQPTAASANPELSLETLLRNLPGMAYRSLNDGIWTMEFVSGGCRELTGYEPDELVGLRQKSFEEIIEPDDRAPVREMITRALERREALEMTYRIRTREGALKWVWERSRPIQDSSGRIQAIEGFIADITERKTLESHVLQNQRIESVGTLAGGISHDLNNVFAPIMMAGGLLSDKIQDKDTGQLLDVISSSAKRGAELVRQILLFARGIEGPRVSVSTATLFADLKTLLDGTMPKTIRVSFEIMPGVSAIAGDPVQLHQMLLNLAVNSRDAMPAGGRLSFTAVPTSVPVSSPRPHPDAVPGDYVRIDVSDTGAGIPDILKGQIFDPFFTTKGVGRGSGLGLSTARSIVKSHRGFITFASTERVGTTFSIFLPTADAGLSRAAKDTTSRTDSTPLPRGSGENILVVDDEASVRLIIRSTLESFGYKSVGAADGTEAIALFRDAPALFHLAIVDMQMPGLDGSMTILALRHLQPDLPIVAASGLATNRNKEEAALNGVRHFLDKPFSVETLIRSVHAAMNPAK